MFSVIQNIIMMLEMLLLSLWAMWLYCQPPGKVSEKVQVVITVSGDSHIKEDIDKSIVHNTDIKM